jgi:hypothetical protein
LGKKGNSNLTIHNNPTLSLGRIQSRIIIGDIFMKKIDTKTLNLILGKLDLIAAWSYEAEQNGIGDAIREVLQDFGTYMMEDK